MGGTIRDDVWGALLEMMYGGTIRDDVWGHY